MYENNQVMAAGSSDVYEQRMTRTVRQNIEAKIDVHKREIAELEKTLGAMPESFLDMSVGQIQKAMSW